MDERRRTERDDGAGDLGVAVRTADGVQTGGHIVMVSHERVTIAFPAQDTPEVEQGARVKLLFRTIRGAELTAIGGLVEEGEHLDGLRLFDFVFQPTARPKQLPPAPISSEGDNRREAYRVKLDRLEIGMTMRPYADPNRSVLRQLMDLRVQGNARTVKGWVLDISCNGICVLIEESDSHGFEPEDHLDLTFTLPGSSEPLRLGVHVKHRTGTRYGLSFDDASTAQFRGVQGQVLEFVMRQQQRELRWRTG